MTARVLVVDDEAAIVQLVSYNLRQAGFSVWTADNGPDALRQVAEVDPDLVVLDWMLPGMDGMEVCRRLRSQGERPGIIMLTARDDEIDRVVGLELGADDYVTKPFSPRELVARVKAVLRRAPARDAGASGDAGVHRVGTLSIHEREREVYVGDRRVELTAREFDLLLYLARHAGQALTREQLLTEVWGYEYTGDSRIVDVHVSHLREKLEEDPRHPRRILTVRGVGYKLAGRSE
ncbi:response regulator transcription factor [Alicyclobacillus sp.]|uniref:response regulator transcription factor n=1 Tax=Alicyclobacillus sp. TaxID=61169 RepID=UPI0025BD61F3|nr:response regulator transcription factor [Alicyclobacillus sp.]MCL6517845.1 response regulator transcription factor [Alicyclobacillus sp.]